ncbi:MAG: tetratricopeptide repeat protein [Okeania sp. SIO3I5]|uniref:CHAT domain-containing protein n=1 Tax=Okeania sp. SIO3I5 TaxID=2607805 RepID=UPI0013B87DAF|nr:CHAT domain-containing tetratricopeptide repeat protein [Okeania sp. SIO3I5]NEQ40828.1 tetratricopeptide repeat protein [Okeania sp. SIO3I5]
MKRIIITSLIGIKILTTTPLILPLLPQRSYAQTSNYQTQNLEKLLEIAWQQRREYQYQESIETFKQAVTIARKNKDREKEADANLGLGVNYYIIGKGQEALNFYNEALMIFREVGDISGVATTLNNVGAVYRSIGQPQKALEYFQQALPIMAEVGDRSREASTLNNIGAVYRSIGQLQEALVYYQQALPIRQEVGDRSGVAITLNNIGQVYSSIGQPQKALEFYQQALSIRQEVGDRPGEAATLNNIGGVYDSIGQAQKALEYLQQALLILQEVGDISGVATTLNNIGAVYYSIDKILKALEYYQQALPILQEVGDISGVAAIFNNIGLVYDSISQPQKALNYYQQALPILQEVGDRSGVAITLNNIGQVYSSIGQPQKALSYYQHALLIMQQVGNRSGVATTLNNIGQVYSSIGQPQKALSYYQQALSIRQEVGDRSGVAITLNNISQVYNSIGQPQKALSYYQQALPILQKVGDRSGVATTLNNIGVVYQNIDEPQKALEYYQQALPILQEVGDRSGVATTLNNIGVVYRDKNQSEKAIENLEKSVEITLEMRGGLKKEYRKAFLEDNERTTIALIDLLIEQNKPDAAWQWYNRVTTFDLADYTRLIDAKVKNPEAQKLINQWQQNNQQLQALYGKIEDEWTPQLSQQVNQLQAESSQLAENITYKYPEVAELFEYKPKDIKKLKANIAPDTVLIQPAFLRDSIAIFFVTRDKPILVKKNPVDIKEFDGILTEYRAQLENPIADDYDVNQEKLYDYLIRPIKAEIAAYSPKQLAIIPTGKLRYIPFETLFDNQANQYLLEKYPIHYLTRISGKRKPESKNTKPLKALAFGNPQPTNIELPGAEAEARIIAEMLSSKYYIREEATLARFQNESLGVPLVHLATHGCFQKGGCPNVGLEENTILFANDKTFHIRDAALLGLENTDLIVLSACQTAMKADSNGEEIAGVAYLFERSGADAVIASLWNVEDDTTKEIMVKFYQYLQQGMTKVEALRQAKLSYAREYVHPFYWSPLILIGN